MIKLLAYKVARVADGKAHLGRTATRYNYYPARSDVTKTLEKHLGHKVFCVEMDVEGIESNNLLEAKLRIGGNSDNCELVGVMDNLTPLLRQATKQITKNLFDQGGFRRE